MPKWTERVNNHANKAHKSNRNWAIILVKLIHVSVESEDEREPYTNQKQCHQTAVLVKTAAARVDSKGQSVNAIQMIPSGLMCYTVNIIRLQHFQRDT